MDIIINAAKQLCNYHLKSLREFLSDSISTVRLSLTTGKNENILTSGMNLNEVIMNFYVSTVEKVKGVLQDLTVRQIIGCLFIAFILISNFYLKIFLQPELSFNLKSTTKGSACIEGVREHLLVGFLKHTAFMMTSFVDVSQTCPPNLHLVLSKTCLEFDKNGVHVLVCIRNASDCL